MPARYRPWIVWPARQRAACAPRHHTLPVQRSPAAPCPWRMVPTSLRGWAGAAGGSAPSPGPVLAPSWFHSTVLRWPGCAAPPITGRVPGARAGKARVPYRLPRTPATRYAPSDLASMRLYPTVYSVSTFTLTPFTVTEAVLPLTVALAGAFIAAAEEGKAPPPAAPAAPAADAPSAVALGDTIPI